MKGEGGPREVERTGQKGQGEERGREGGGTERTGKRAQEQGIRR